MRWLLLSVGILGLGYGLVELPLTLRLHRQQRARRHRSDEWARYLP